MAWTKAHERILLSMLDDIACPKCGSKEHDATIAPKVESARLSCKRCKHVWLRVF